jgi:hypothetical protein
MLPCAATAARGRHLRAPHATLLWAIPILLLAAVELAGRRGALRIPRAPTASALYVALACCAGGLAAFAAAAILWISR